MKRHLVERLMQFDLNVDTLPNFFNVNNFHVPLPHIRMRNVIYEVSSPEDIDVILQEALKGWIDLINTRYAECVLHAVLFSLGLDLRFSKSWMAPGNSFGFIAHKDTLEIIYGDKPSRRLVLGPNLFIEAHLLLEPRFKNWLKEEFGEHFGPEVHYIVEDGLLTKVKLPKLSDLKF